MLFTRKSFLDRLDKIAEVAAGDSTSGTAITELILRTIIDLYEAAKAESQFAEEERFETAYHSPITGDLEFFIARILYHYSALNRLPWKILLRRQIKKTAPDIRIEVAGITIAVIEVKAKAGWMQGFFSSERFEKDKTRFAEKGGDLDPEAAVAGARKQLTKYQEAFGLTTSDVFMLLPTFARVHRNKYTTDLDGYLNTFALNSGLPKENLILLSSNFSLDLSYGIADLCPTNNFERLLEHLRNQTPKPQRIPPDAPMTQPQPTVARRRSDDENQAKRLRANSREFMRKNFPELTQYHVRTSRMSLSSENPQFCDDWWFTVSLLKLFEKGFAVLVCSLDNANKNFKVLKVPADYFVSNAGKLDVSKNQIVTLYLKIDDFRDVRHQASLPFAQFAVE